jgi:hypothetical protein
MNIEYVDTSPTQLIASSETHTRIQAEPRSLTMCSSAVISTMDHRVVRPIQTTKQSAHPRIPISNEYFEKLAL